jgi:translation elongation factor EF-Tu-like GTPase
MTYPRDVEVEVAFLSTDNDGRQGPAYSGYRPQFFYGGQNWDAIYTFVGVESVDPGETARAYLSFLSPEAHIGVVHAGMPFLIREGRRIVGFGAVVRILDLEANAGESLARQHKR